MFTSVFLQNTLTAMASFAGVVALAGVPVSAQPSAKPLPELRKILVTPSPAESIEAPLAAKLADRLGQVWFESAEPACRASRSLDLASYQKLARTNARGGRRAHEATCRERAGRAEGRRRIRRAGRCRGYRGAAAPFRRTGRQGIRCPDAQPVRGGADA